MDIGGSSFCGTAARVGCPCHLLVLFDWGGRPWSQLMATVGGGECGCDLGGTVLLFELQLKGYSHSREVDDSASAECCM